MPTELESSSPNLRDYWFLETGMSRFYTLCIDRKYRDILNEKINYIHKTTKKATTKENQKFLLNLTPRLILSFSQNNTRGFISKAKYQPQ